MSPRLELVTTGAELLNGSVLNGHARWLGQRLAMLGWSLERDTTVSDDADAIHDAMISALSRVDVILVSGGLGPTEDDRTRDAAARWAGRGVVMDEPTRRHVVDIYHQRGKPLNSSVERHALVVEGADVLSNSIGLAPGEHLRKDRRHLFLLPGPPHEFHTVFDEHIAPRLRALAGGGLPPVHLFQTAGTGESDIAALIAEQAGTAGELTVAYCANPGHVMLRVHPAPGAEAAFSANVEAVRRVLADRVFSERDESIEETAARLLGERKLTLATAESCTGGLIGARLTAIPGSSAWFRGGVIAYANEVKERLLGVPREQLDRHGAVSAEVAGAMAAGVRAATGADIGLSVTGIAGPGGGTAEKPVGLVYIGLSDAAGTIHVKRQFGGGREVVRASTAVVALDLVRRRLTGAA